MNRQDGLGAFGDSRLDTARIYVERFRIDVHEARPKPVYSIAATVATKVNGVVITSPPAPTPAASSAKCSALVPEFTAIPAVAPE